MIRHFLLLVLLAGAACALATPLPAHLSTAIIGAGVGDNVTGLWNVWWTRAALAEHAPLLVTPAIFAPFGVNLVLHSLSPLVSVAAVGSAPGAGAVTTYNVALLGCLVLNLWTAYALGWVISRDRLAAVFAALAFATAPMLLVRLYGHLNLIAAWVLPLLLLAVLRFENRPGWRRAIAVAICLAATVYTDYYYAVFGAAAAAIHVALWRVPMSLKTRPLTRPYRVALTVLIGAIVLVVAIAIWVAVTGGAIVTIAGRRLGMTGTFNLRVIVGLLTTLALFAWKRPTLARTSVLVPREPTLWWGLSVVGGLTLLLIAPLLTEAVRIWLSGDYVSQAYVWRNAPKGVDVATMVLGNPMSLLTGAWTTSVYEWLRIDGTEGVAWIGLAPLAMAVLALRQKIDHRVRTYLWIAAFFFVWSLGPYLQAFGWNTAVMLPATLTRYVPLISNARIPGRAFVVVALAVAMLGAIGLASLRRSNHPRFVPAVLALLVIDIWPAPHVLVAVPQPPIYDRLRDRPAGVVLNVPIGYRDGFGERGGFDPWTLAYQTQHAKPMVGGFVARLSPRIRNGYEGDPLLRPLLDASEGRPITVRTDTCRDSVVCAVRYVVLNRETASPLLVSLIEDTFVLRELDRDATRTVFAAESVRTCACSEGPARAHRQGVGVSPENHGK